MAKNKYTYEKILQGHYGHGWGWDDECAYNCNSRGVMTVEDRAALRNDIEAYRKNSTGRYRVIFRREEIE